MSGILEQIDIRRLYASKHRLRKEPSQLDELMASIIDKGVLQPIVVRPFGKAFEVVAGNRRLEACKRLKLSRILCHIIELDDKEAYEVSLIENVQHKTLNPMEEAEAFKKYVDEYGFGGISELARRIGKSHSYISRRISLLNLPSDFQEQLVRWRTNPSVAQEILSLDEDQRQTVLELIVDKKVTRRRIRHIVKQVREDHGSELNLHNYSKDEKRQLVINRILTKYITSLRICMMRLDDALDTVDEGEWLVREILGQHRSFIHNQIDRLLKFKKILQRVSPPYG